MYRDVLRQGSNPRSIELSETHQERGPTVSLEWSASDCEDAIGAVTKKKTERELGLGLSVQTNAVDKDVGGDSGKCVGLKNSEDSFLTEDLYDPADKIINDVKNVASNDDLTRSSQIDIGPTANISNVTSESDHLSSQASQPCQSQCDILFVLLSGTKELLQSRLAARKGHFMNPDLLTSQLTILEVPDKDEKALIVDIGQSVDEIVEQIRNRSTELCGL